MEARREVGNGSVVHHPLSVAEAASGAVLRPDSRADTAGHNSNFAGQWSRRVATATAAIAAGAGMEATRARLTAAAAAEVTPEAAAITVGAGTEATRARHTAAVAAEAAAMQAVAVEASAAGRRGDTVAVAAAVVVIAREVVDTPEAAGT